MLKKVTAAATLALAAAAGIAAVADSAKAGGYGYGYSYGAQQGYAGAQHVPTTRPAAPRAVAPIVGQGDVIICNGGACLPAGGQGVAAQAISPSAGPAVSLQEQIEERDRFRD